MSRNEKEPVFEECPSCLVSLSGDETINQMAVLLQETFEMLRLSLCPYTTQGNIRTWYESQADLRARIEEIIGPMDLH